MRFLAPSLVVAVLALSACENEPPKTALGYTENAKRAYESALEEFNAHRWIESQLSMREVKRKYSYSKYARLAELRIADADYEQEKFAEAAHEYKDFIRAHKAEDEEVAYARSRIAEASCAEIPESFLMPAAEERDQGAVVEAYKEIRSFIADYPNAKQTPHIRELQTKIVGRLVRHELYVARFYLAKDNFLAAVSRIQYALANYGGDPAEGAAADADLLADAQLLLGETYLKMHKWKDARESFEGVLRRTSTGGSAARARRYLGHLTELGT
jgi:outer membrane protein assembly factor BamD